MVSLKWFSSFSHSNSFAVLSNCRLANWQISRRLYSVTEYIKQSLYISTQLKASVQYKKPTATYCCWYILWQIHGTEQAFWPGKLNCSYGLLVRRAQLMSTPLTIAGQPPALIILYVHHTQFIINASATHPAATQYVASQCNSVRGTPKTSLHQELSCWVFSILLNSLQKSCLSWK